MRELQVLALLKVRDQQTNIVQILRNAWNYFICDKLIFNYLENALKWHVSFHDT